MRKYLAIVLFSAVAGAAGAGLSSRTEAQMPVPGLPAGMVSFFSTPTCPTGWSEASPGWRGRYIVVAAGTTGATVGTALSPSENRPTGDHSHGAPVSFYGGSCPTNPTGNCVRWAEAGAGRGPRSVGGAEALNPGETIVPGTNAPYVELRACVKN